MNMNTSTKPRMTAATVQTAPAAVSSFVSQADDK